MNCYVYVNGGCVKQVSGIEAVYSAWEAAKAFADVLIGENTVWLVSCDTGEILEEYVSAEYVEDDGCFEEGYSF